MLWLTYCNNRIVIKLWINLDFECRKLSFQLFSPLHHNCFEVIFLIQSLLFWYSKCANYHQQILRKFLFVFSTWPCECAVSSLCGYRLCWCSLCCCSSVLHLSDFFCWWTRVINENMISRWVILFFIFWGCYVSVKMLFITYYSK